MYARSLSIQNNSFFLFGPRGVGKSTWAKTNYPTAYRIDLLKSENYLRLQSEPTELAKEILAQPKGSWIMLDEIQKLPILLDEIHAIIEDHKDRYKFILTGSSARKLKREGGNLLAGRVLDQHMFPLTSTEMHSDFNLDESLKLGNLPIVVNQKTVHDKIDFLTSYVTTYLKEEIQQEAAVKNLGAYTRFLKIAALSNAQKLNLSNLARNTGVGRSTVQGYFQILIDTLLGDMLQPWPLKFRVKEVDHPKFYFFDTGVVRTLQNLLRDPMDKTDFGFLLETFIFHELKAFDHYKKMGGEFYFWGTHGGMEVDFIYSRGKTAIGIEVKSGTRWRSEDSEVLKLLLKAKKIKHAYAIYMGDKILNDDGVWIFPVSEFLSKLYSGDIDLF